MSSELNKFWSQTVRGPRERGVYQTLMASLLAKATRTSDPLLKISNIAEAALMSRCRDQLDMPLVETAYTVSFSFLNTDTRREPVQVCWSFETSEANWARFIQPWQKIGLTYYPLETYLGQARCLRRHRPQNPFYNYRDANRDLEAQEKLRDRLGEQIERLPPYRAFFEKTSALSRQSFYALRGEFERWALPRLLEVQASLAEELDPSILREALFSGATKEKEAEEADGNPMA